MTASPNVKSPGDVGSLQVAELRTAVTLCLGITGHRAHHPSFAANKARIEAVLDEIFVLIESAARQASDAAPTRLHSMLADGTDQMAAEMALARGWSLVSPLPFGRALNIAINSHPQSAADARAILEGREAEDLSARTHALAVAKLLERARVFELADRDHAIEQLYLAKLEAPTDIEKSQLFTAVSSERAAVASRLVIEQSDIIIAVWDGATAAPGGGTGHTIAQALHMGAPVVWIDARTPEVWRILRGPESLSVLDAGAPPQERAGGLQALVREIVAPDDSEISVERALERESWRARSAPVWHGYRFIETLFGGENFSQRFRNLRQSYEAPCDIAEGSAAGALCCARSMPGQDSAFVSRIETDVLRRFAWFDGVSSRLSDKYRGGMVVNFLLAPLAIIAGIAYLPFAAPHEKWMFALAEFALLVSIIGITSLGQARRWHGRWFETRRVAEYFRHAPILLVLGVARAPGRWPRGVDASWPEWFARQALRHVGLPHVAVTSLYLRIALQDLLDSHVVRQRDYHIVKAKRLAAAHKNLDRLSSLLFILAVVSVAGYLLLKASGVFTVWPEDVAERVSYFFTFMGVFFPTFGGAVAGIRYFGDFERFAAISEVTAEKLDAVHSRIVLLLSAPDSEIDYGRVSDLAHAADDIVVTEIENWQAVFGGKHITIPI